MTGGIIQLVAYGVEDIFLTRDPQITFFKVVYRRHTNFSTEDIPQYFTQKPSWGKSVSCTISPDGDLVKDIYLVIHLPAIKKFKTNNGDDDLTKFAWVRRLGFVMIKSIEIEINGRVIDRHYGEWLNLWMELFGPKDEGMLKMIGDTEDLTSFTNGKDPYTLYIPLKFWFCRSSGLALPIVSLKYSDIKINLELNDFENCYVITPTHYIKCEAELVNFKQYEYIEQVVDNITYAGIFTHYDILNKRLYYTKISKEKFIGIYSSITNPSQSQKNAILEDTANEKYRIVGKTSKFYVLPSINETTKNHQYTKLKNVALDNVYLLVNYVFLDEDERMKFAQAKHDYLIEQLFFTPNTTLEGANRSIKVNIDHPCKMLVWVVQMNYIDNANDPFNYTNSYVRKKFSSEYPNVKLGDVVGDSLINDQTILLNGHERIKLRSEDYFSNVQHYQNAQFSPSTGINSYFFSIYPNSTQPSGSCNMSQMGTIEIQLRMSHMIDALNLGKIRSYGLCQNILRVSHGLAAVVFNR